MPPNSYNKYVPARSQFEEGEEDEEKLKLVMTVLNETKAVNGIGTRVVEEKETERDTINIT